MIYMCFWTLLWIHDNYIIKSFVDFFLFLWPMYNRGWPWCPYTLTIPFCVSALQTYTPHPLQCFSNFNLIVSYWYQCLQNCWNTIFPRVSFLLSSETTIEGTEKRCFIYFNSHGNWHIINQTHNKKWTVVGNSVALTRCTLRICYLQSAKFNICKT